MNRTKEKRHVIWSSDINIDDWQDFLSEEHPEVTDESEQYALCQEMNDEYLQDERVNLNIELGREIIILGDLGFWNGRAHGYKEMKGTNIKDCLDTGITCGEYITWYVDELGDLRCDDTHHDGTNHYLFRVYKKGVTWEQKENFKWKIYSGKVTRQDINRYTERLGGFIADVYGFPIRKASSRIMKNSVA